MSLKDEIISGLLELRDAVTRLEAKAFLLSDEVMPMLETEPTSEPVPTPVTDPAPRPMRVREVSLNAGQLEWLGKLQTTASWANPSATYNMEALAASGRLQDLSRHLNQQLEAVLAVLRATGRRELLEKVYIVSQKLRGTLSDAYVDGFLSWVQTSENVNLGGLENTDLSVLEEIMAHSTVAQVAWAFRLNGDLDPKYDEAASFWLGYLTEHYEPKWRGRNKKPSGYPFIEKPLFHNLVNAVQYMEYMYLLTDNLERKAELDRLVGILKAHLMPDGPYKLVWPHFVNTMLPPAERGYIYQPMGYSGESASGLADLGFQGVLDDSTMKKIAKAVTVNMLDGLSPGFLAPCIGGSTSRLHYSAADGKEVRFNVPDYPRGTSFYWQSRGFALLEPFDDGDKIRQRSVLTHGQAQVWPMPAVGALLGAS